MKPNTAAIRIKDWGGQQVVHIDEIRAHHNETRSPPLFFPQHLRKDEWDYQMIGIVENMPKDVYIKKHQQEFGLVHSSALKTCRLPL